MKLLRSAMSIVLVTVFMLWVILVAGLFGSGPFYWIICILFGVIVGVGTRVGAFKMKGTMAIVITLVIVKLSGLYVLRNVIPQSVQNWDWVIGTVCFVGMALLFRWYANRHLPLRVESH